MPELNEQPWSTRATTVPSTLLDPNDFPLSQYKSNYAKLFMNDQLAHIKLPVELQTPQESLF